MKVPSHFIPAYDNILSIDTNLSKTSTLLTFENKFDMPAENDTFYLDHRQTLYRQTFLFSHIFTFTKTYIHMQISKEQCGKLTKLQTVR